MVHARATYVGTLSGCNNGNLAQLGLRSVAVDDMSAGSGER